MLLSELAVAAIEWVLLVEHFVQDYTNGPQVALHCVGRTSCLAEVDFRSHGIWSSASSALHLQLVSQELGQSKVSDFEAALSDEYVFELEVSVDDVCPLQRLHSLN